MTTARAAAAALALLVLAATDHGVVALSAADLAASTNAKARDRPDAVAMKWQPKPMVPVPCPTGTPPGCKCFKDSHVQDCRGAPKPKKKAA